MIRLAFEGDDLRTLEAHFGEHAPAEAGAFCLLREVEGAESLRLLAGNVVIPPREAWEIQSAHQLRPSAQYLSAMVSLAHRNRSGLLFLHSHPDSSHPSGLSLVDISAFEDLARTLSPVVDGPFGAVVAHEAGWSGCIWSRATEKPELIDRIVGVGRTVRILDGSRPPMDTELDSRQRDALGQSHSKLRKLTIAVVGCGGTGSPIAEQLVRMGVAEVILLDHDYLDTPSNVRRVFGSTALTLSSSEVSSKVDVVGDHLDAIGLETRVRRVTADVRSERAFRHLLDADVVIGATDTQGSRALLNDLPYAYLIPVIDVGVRVGSREPGVLSALVAEVRILMPPTPCLWCRGTIDANVIRAENLPADEYKRLVKEGYLVGGLRGEPAPSVVALTVLGSGLTTCALLGLLSEEGDAVPHGYLVDGFLGDSIQMGPQSPTPGCRCRKNLGSGNALAPPFVAESPDESELPAGREKRA